MSREMDKNRGENQKKKELQIGSLAAKYLTSTTTSGDDREAIKIGYEDESIWLTQKMMAALYDVSTTAINQHLKKMFDNNELQGGATIKNFLIVQKENSRSVSGETKRYNLQAITAVGFKVDNERAVQSRRWMNQIVKDSTIKDWAMDDERLKNSSTKLIKDYLEELLVKIREIRLSERRFY